MANIANRVINQKYHDEKAKLNPEQRLAVETIEGPVMVLAGPGTGKTQVLAFRVAEILQKTDLSPRNILALTFTESGVTAMRQRLASLIGVEAYAVGVYTFHGFANRIINDAGAEFYKTHSLDPIDEVTQLRLVMELVDAQDNVLLRPFRAPHWYVKPIMNAIKSIKNEGVSPDHLRDLCRQEIESLTNTEGSLSKTGKNKGGLKESVKGQIKQLERTLALADIFERYETELAERGFYDYEDMILFVMKSFRDNASLKAKYQEQFQYILVDEYQDTNNAQNTLVRVLADFFASPNLFVVGDDKQSIYRFQGASMANLLNYREWYPQAKLISLRHNYRSGQIILDNADSLIRHNQEQLDVIIPELETQLIAEHSNSTLSFTPYTTFDKEVMGITYQIKKLLEQGVKASQIAIIYRENREAESFIDVFNRQGISFHLEAGTNVLRDPDVEQLINLLKLAENPDDDTAFFYYLHTPYSQVATTDLVTLSRWRKHNTSTWVELINGELPQTDIPLQSWDLVKNLRTKVENWHRFGNQRNLGDAVEFILMDSGLLNFIMTQTDHLQRLHRLRCFFDEIKKIMTAVQFAKLKDLFEVIYIRERYNLTLTCLPLIERSDDAIRLMTAHRSKGLEFEHVFIPHFYDGLWSNSRRHDTITLPAGIVPHHHVTSEQETQEDRRLFYVALTRAKKSVSLSSSELDADNKKLIPCQFLSELGDVTLLEPNINEQLPLQDFFSPINTRFVEDTSQAYLKEIVTKQAITPTGLNTYLTCPLEYLYKNVYAIPGIREPYQSYGTAIHKALELWGDWSNGTRTTYDIQDILSVFDEILLKEGLTEREISGFKQLGHDVLRAYYEKHREIWVPPLAAEYNFTPHKVMLDGKIPITGTLDKIEPIKGSTMVRVVDFKTGKVRSRNDIEGKTASSDGDYKRQLVFYTILAESDPIFNFKIGEVAIAFLDDDKKFTVECFEITRQEKEEVKELICSIYNEITSLHFDHTPHKKRFGNDERSLCDFLRYGYQS